MAKSKLEEALEKYMSGRVELRAGILDKETYPLNEDGSGGEYVAQVAYIQEFGAPGSNIPPRPFFRSAIAINKKNWSAVIARGLKNYNGDVALAFGSAGEVIIDDLRESVRTWSSPPNAESTVRKKKFNNPLIHTGQLMNSFSYEVNDD
ncbi:TPA: hypothetical protein ACWLWR_000286 [Morganella morganii]